MAVHDVGSYREGLKPGQVFSVDPQLRVPEENLYLRYEDTIVVTETGYENFTHFLPIELDAMEALVRETGIVQKAPPGPEMVPMRWPRLTTQKISSGWRPACTSATASLARPANGLSRLSGPRK